MLHTGNIKEPGTLGILLLSCLTAFVTLSIEIAPFRLPSRDVTWTESHDLGQPINDN